MASQPLGFGVIAVGGIGSLHARNIARRVPGARLVAVTDIDAARAKDVANEYSAAFCVDHTEMLGRSDIDAIVIAAPSSIHAALTIEAVKAGKHVLCEKPLTCTIDDADQVVSAVQASDVVAHVGFQRRHDPDWRQAKASLRAGELGRPRLYFSSYREKEPLDGDELRDVLIHGNIHDLDASRWMIGEIDEISVIGQSFDDQLVTAGGQVENLVTTLRFANGALGVIDNGTNARFGFECKAEIVGTDATLRISNSETESVEMLREGSSSQAYPADSAERFDRAYVDLISDFCAAIAGRGSSRGASVFDGRAALVLALAAEESLVRGRPIRLTRTGSENEIEYQIAK